MIRPTAPGQLAARAGVKTPRRLAREFALLGLYEHLVGRSDYAAIDAHMRAFEGFDGFEDFARCDGLHFEALLRGCIDGAEGLDTLMAAYTDRAPHDLSPVEHAVLRIGFFELQSCIDIPYRVVLNEAIDLSRSFGGTDGHKYVNGVLDRAAGALRPLETAQGRPPRR